MTNANGELQCGRTPFPTDGQIRGFFAKLTAWRATLTESEQRLTDSMLAAVLGKTVESCDEADDMWLDDSGDDILTAAQWLSTPWGMMYTLRYR
jgi:hypothetical protein